MSPGKRATLPAAGYRRPSNLSTDGLVVDVVGEDGEHHGQIDFRDAVGPDELRRELVAGFARRCSSTGTWTRYRSCQKYGSLLKRFLAFLAELDTPPQRVAEITPGACRQTQPLGPAASRTQHRPGREQHRHPLHRGHTRRPRPGHTPLHRPDHPAKPA